MSTNFNYAFKLMSETKVFKKAICDVLFSF